MMRNKLSVPDDILQFLHAHGFCCEPERAARKPGWQSYKNDTFAIHIFFEERDREVGLLIGPLDPTEKDFFPQIVIAFIRNDDALVQSTVRISNLLEENYDELARVFGPQSSCVGERQRLKGWLVDLAQRQTERSCRAAEEGRKKRSGRSWWKFWRD